MAAAGEVGVWQHQQKFFIAVAHQVIVLPEYGLGQIGDVDQYPLNQRRTILLPQLTNRYALEFKVVEAAFKAANLPVPLDLSVTPARIDNKPLKEYLQSILTQVRATFDVAEQTVLIIPARPAAKP